MILRTLDEVAAAIPAGDRVVVGIAGAPGAGKSTVAATLVASLPSAVLLPMDGFHLPQARLVELGRRDRMGAPDTFDVEGFAATVEAARSGPTTAPGFDRTVEEPVPGAVTIADERVVVVEGNYLLHWGVPFDVTFVVDVDHDVRIERLVERHIRFGKSPEDARAWSLGPDEANAVLVTATAGRADHVIRLD